MLIALSVNLGTFTQQSSLSLSDLHGALMCEQLGRDFLLIESLMFEQLSPLVGPERPYSGNSTSFVPHLQHFFWIN